MKKRLLKIFFTITMAIYALEILYFFVCDFGGAYHVNIELKDNFIYSVFVPPALIGISIFLLSGHIRASVLSVVFAVLVGITALLIGAPDIERQETLRVEINGMTFVARGTYYDELYPPLKHPEKSTQIYFRDNPFLWKRVLTVGCDIESIAKIRDGIFIAKMQTGCDKTSIQFQASIW